MRSFIQKCLAVIGLVAGLRDTATAQCLLCASGAQKVSQTSDAEVIYVAPKIAERLTDPFAVMFAAAGGVNLASVRDGFDHLRYANVSITEMFKRAVVKPELYVILEVRRVIEAKNETRAIFWFAYIEKEKIRPLDLPAEKPLEAVKKK